eukprot:CAMPEP_0201948616 /NCGR_PEP_ID=MMETSP0903-20130614/55556_1 /ASSEMBLY_ACC=CAM_ASM_000552 /TAXON_ID=420261 /ORGANISM="Thalassiosira antarctica, Strain CCMP982" /LENGTH=155 /DNA_ID=CAMNT_0048491805 /DNA_START=128 /DNA_END=593 /DNA_ORIENTATION=+
MAISLLIASIAVGCFDTIPLFVQAVQSTTKTYSKYDAIASPFFLAEEVDPRAKCLDGSSGVIYVSPSPTRPRPCQIESIGKDGVPYVPLNLTGLGQDEEHTVDHCYSRSLYYKGSTAVNVTTNDMRSLTGVASGAQYVSRNPSTNPTMGDWCFAW